MEDWTAELNQLEQQLVRAWIERDRETIDAILSDDWAVIDPGGRLLTKAQVLAEAFESGDREIEGGQIDDVRVRSYGEMAVVTGRTVATGTYKGVRATVKLRFTDVCIRRNESWQVVASQATLLNEG